MTWFVIPSKKPKAEAEVCIQAWQAQGYSVAIWRDEGDESVECDLLLMGKYPGYANAVNALCREVLERHPKTEWLVSGGDDTLPDSNKRADEIARECVRHFGMMRSPFPPENGKPERWNSCTFGVMQPTGDRWGDSGGAYIDRIAGSPWMGAEWCRRMYGGEGPMWPGWQHFFVDEEIMQVAIMLGVFWQRPDLTHFHKHWIRDGKAMPRYLAEINSPAHWAKYKPMYDRRRAAGFPGHEPVQIEVAA